MPTPAPLPPLPLRRYRIVRLAYESGWDLTPLPRLTAALSADGGTLALACDGEILLLSPQDALARCPACDRIDATTL